MSVQRQYSLPYCTLALEGLSQGALTSDAFGRPSLDVVIRFECKLMGQDKRLVGGKELLEGLQVASAEAAQSWLSGVQPLRGHFTPKGGGDDVLLTPTQDDHFDLTVQQTVLATSEPSTEPVHLKLSLLQLFDLVEAFDQLLADSQTLPKLAWQPTSLLRSQSSTTGSSLKNTAPPFLGTSGLAVAAALLFLMPIPQVRRSPEPSAPQQTAPATVPPVPVPSAPVPSVTVSPTPTLTPSPATSESVAPQPPAAPEVPPPAPESQAPAAPAATPPPPAAPPATPQPTPPPAPAATPQPSAPVAPATTPQPTAPVAPPAPAPEAPAPVAPPPVPQSPEPIPPAP
jgi:Domain of unknown function (DUF4335)